MGWLDHDRLGFNYRLSDVACALGLAQLDRLDDDARRPGAGGRHYRDALAGIEGLELPCPDAGGAAAAGSSSSSSCRAGSTATTSIRAPGRAGDPSKPYFPAIHLMSYYRESFGHREGQFPVCEDVAARSIALPFFPAMTEGQVARVAVQLGSVLRR